MSAAGSILEPEAANQTRSHAAAQLLEMIGGSWMTQAIGVAAELGLADALAKGPRSAAQLAALTDSHPAALRRLLRGLAALGVVRDHGNGDYGLTDVGNLLRSDAQSGLRAWAMWWSRYLWPTWGELRQCVRTGRSARELATGTTGYTHIEADPRAAAVFNRAMTDLTALVAEDVLRNVDISATRCVADIGGGNGELLAHILRAQPLPRGVLLELPHAIGGAAAHMAAAGVAERCELIAGSFFDAVPAGADMYLLKSVLHNWDDAKCTVILSVCRRAMDKRARLIIIERVAAIVVGDCATDRAIARTDLNMLVGLGGSERTEAEFTRLLTDSGFRPTRIRPLAAEFTVIEAVPS